MSADEIDAELLAMAGDSSDDEDESGSLVDAVSDRSPSQEPKPSVEKRDEGRAKGVAQKVRKRGGRKKVRKNESEDENDFGEISEASSPRSSGMEPASPVSSADAPASPPLVDDDALLYPVDGKFVSEQEKADILSRPEIEREQLLAERQELVQKRKQDLQLAQLFAKARKDGEKVRKRKVEVAAFDDDDQKRSVRPKAEERGRNKALDAYKQAREAKGADRTSRLEVGSKTKRNERSPSSVGSDRDADAESEVEWAEPLSSSRRDRDEPPATIRDFEHCRVGRSNFARICFWPGFEETIKGCFVRVSIGMDRATGQNSYRMAQVKGFTEGRPYQLEYNGKTFTTDQHVVLSQGTNSRPFPFNICSDSRFTDQEYDRYVNTLQKEGLRLPSQKLLLQKNDDINKLVDRRWTDAEISERLKRTEEMRQKHDPANQQRLKRDRILRDKARAEEEGDEEAVSRFEAELTALGNSMNGTSISRASIKSSPVKPGSALAQDRLAQLNKLNKQKTADEVRKALVEEKKKLQRAREKAAADAAAKREEERVRAEAEKAKKLLGVNDDMADLFGSDISRSGTPQPGGTPRRSRAGTPLNGIKKERSQLGASGLRKKGNMDDEVIGGMDLGIDIEI